MVETIRYAADFEIAKGAAISRDREVGSQRSVHEQDALGERA